MTKKLSLHRCIYLLVILLIEVGVGSVSFAKAPLNSGVNNQTLAILVNQNDPESIEIAKYYQRARQIPDENVIYLDFTANVDALSESDFKRLNRQLEIQVPEQIQAYALAWRKPWKVGCMSITSAFSLGFSHKYCANGCQLTQPVEYFNSPSKQPYSDFGIRPAMMLSAKSVKAVSHLIDRGVLSDDMRPLGEAFLLNTSDKKRSVRSAYYPFTLFSLNSLIRVNVLDADAIKHQNNIMFYFTGLVKVPAINDNIYLPGAMADHLTSFGGHLFNGPQMSILEWIDAGATGTYGAVVEPCGFTQKFPNPAIAMKNYLLGSTLIEAYWKSVRMPGQGVFVGEPLAAPFRGCKARVSRDGRVMYVPSDAENYVERRSRSCR